MHGVNEEYSRECMLNRNRYLVDHTACLSAIYNGNWRSGTAMTVRYVQKLEREIILIKPV